jgi:NAD(P)H-hydrate epimerase
VIQALQDTKLPVTSVDAPSSWDIEDGPPKSGLGSSFMLVSQRPTRVTNLQHRFVTPSIAKKFDFEVPEYKGIDQVVEVEVSEQKL